MGMGRKPFLAVVLLLGACGAEEDAPAPSPSEFHSEVQLGALLPAGAQLTGVAVTPEGQTYVLDQRSGLYELGKSTATLVFATSDLATRFGISPAPLFTDVAALGDERFALTAENDGFMLDLHGGTFTSYFCYLPAAGPSSTQVVSVSTRYRDAGIPVKERTESVAFSPQSLQLFAQPQTIRLDTGEVVGSELFAFAESGGQPNQVTAMAELGFLAGGMVAVYNAVFGPSLLLGAHDRLYLATATATGSPTLLRDFEAPIEITGMARAKDGNLLLLDGAGQRLLEVSGY